MPAGWECRLPLDPVHLGRNARGPSTAGHPERTRAVTTSNACRKELGIYNGSVICDGFAEKPVLVPQIWPIVPGGVEDCGGYAAWLDGQINAWQFKIVPQPSPHTHDGYVGIGKWSVGSLLSPCSLARLSRSTPERRKTALYASSSCW